MKIELASPVSFIRAGITEPGFNHILSFRRQAYVPPEIINTLPERIQVDYDGTSYWIYVSSDSMTCFLCKKEGHVANKCPNNTQSNENSNPANNASDILNVPNFRPPVTFKRPHPPTTTESSQSAPAPTEILLSDSEAMSESDSSEVSIDDTDPAKKVVKKPKRTIDIQPSEITEIEKILESGDYPMSIKEFMSFLDESYGKENILQISLTYTDDIGQTLVDKPPKRPWFADANLNKRDLTLSFRLRSNHIPLNNFIYLMGKTDNPNCTACDRYEDLYHMLMECRRNEGKQEEDPRYTLTTNEDGATVFSCKICQKVFKKKDLVKQHYNEVHLKKRRQFRSCHLCDVLVPSHKRPAHMEEAHGVPMPKCNACGRKFAYEFKLLRHQRTFHMGERNYECDVCHKKCARAYDLNKHMFVHRSERPFECNVCDKSFKTAKYLEIHMRIHLNDRRFVCKLCGESFVQWPSLKYHVTKRHPEEP
ncbi:zinc finger protein 26-like [Aricia agestis]|uniref:zinc finger protein 26-like n=1 Tax=Aricia agestis TaxID=91739 RepID=UPI001C20BF44|nr:zinc finger protein 26-like [Aricia agestis]